MEVQIWHQRASRFAILLWKIIFYLMFRKTKAIQNTSFVSPFVSRWWKTTALWWLRAPTQSWEISSILAEIAVIWNKVQSPLEIPVPAGAPASYSLGKCVRRLRNLPPSRLGWKSSIMQIRKQERTGSLENTQMGKISPGSSLQIQVHGLGRWHFDLHSKSGAFISWT